MPVHGFHCSVSEFCNDVPICVCWLRFSEANSLFPCSCFLCSAQFTAATRGSVLSLCIVGDRCRALWCFLLVDLSTFKLEQVTQCKLVACFSVALINYRRPSVPTSLVRHSMSCVKEIIEAAELSSREWDGKALSSLWRICCW